MKYIPFGNEKTKASVIGVGCMRIADMQADAVEELIDASLDAGINFFDHADIYGGGNSEKVFGEVLHRRPDLRDRIILQSKCSIHDGMYDFDKDYILQSVDGILTRLQTDHLDSLLLHRPDVLMEPELINEAFEELLKAGKVLHFGVSNMNPYQMELLQSGINEKITVNQLQMSIVHAPMIEEGINVNTGFDGAVMRNGGTLEYCRIHNIILQTWSPLQKGFFGGVFLNDPSYAELNALMDELADKYNVVKDAIAYAWILRLPHDMQVITGTTKKERILTAVQGSEIQLTRKEWYDLYKAAGRQLP